MLGTSLDGNTSSCTANKPGAVRQRRSISLDEETIEEGLDAPFDDAAQASAFLRILNKVFRECEDAEARASIVKAIHDKKWSAALEILAWEAKDKHLKKVEETVRCVLCFVGA